jgi:hypothetical protein
MSCDAEQSRVMAEHSLPPPRLAERTVVSEDDRRRRVRVRWRVAPFRTVVDPDDALPVLPPTPLSEVSVTVPRTGLAPGRYTLRLVAADGATTSHPDESIVVRDGARARR